MAQREKNPPAVRETWLRKIDPLEKGMSTHSSILTWRIPWTEELGGLYAVHGGCKELRTTERLTLSFFTFTRKRVGFPIFLVPYFILLATGQMVRWTRQGREGENSWLESPQPDPSPSQLSFLPASWLCPSESHPSFRRSFIEETS